MMLSTEVGNIMTREDLLSLHYIEATCTSRWALGFFLAHCIPQSGKLGSADTARLCEQRTQALLSMADSAPRDSLEVPADLPLCNAMLPSLGYCLHTSRVVDAIQEELGNTWTTGAARFLVQSMSYSQCPQLRSWRSAVLQEMSDHLDAFIISRGDQLCDVSGMPVLISPHKARRLSSLIRGHTGVKVNSSESCKRVIEKSDERDSVNKDAERAEMAAYLEASAEEFAGVTRYGCCVDCSTVRGRDLLTCAAQTPIAASGKDYATWLPPQDLLCFCLFCF